MKFSDVTGHDRVKDQLRQMVDTNNVPHALMLAGVPGIGKMNLARALAQYIHCSDRKNGEPCGECTSCKQHENFNNPDVHFSYPVIRKSSGKPMLSEDFFDNWKEMLAENPYMPWEKWLDILEVGNSQPLINVDESAWIINRASMSAFKENYKVFIIWLPEKLNTEAANKLLKILEEPFTDTIFILVTNDEKSVLPTIYSRTQTVRMMPVDETVIADYLSGKCGVEPEQAKTLARLAGGRPGKAYELSSHSGETLEFRELFQQFMRMSYARDYSELLRLAETSASLGREKLQRFLDYMAGMIRENFIYNLKYPPLNVMMPEDEAFSTRFSPFVNHANVERMSLEIDRTRNDISRNGNAKIVMFDFLLYLTALIRLK